MVLHLFLVISVFVLFVVEMATQLKVVYRKHGFPPHFGKNPAIANHSSLEVNEEREDMDDSKSCKDIG